MGWEVLRPAVLAGAVLLAAGCSSRFSVLVKVKPDVDAPKAVDIVWVLTENDAVVNTEILDYRKKGMAAYFGTGRSTLPPGYFRFYRFQLEGDAVPREGPLEVRSDPGSTRPKLYGPFHEGFPPGASKAFLFIEYGAGTEKLHLPMMVYPTLSDAPGYENVSPGGISIEIGRDGCSVKPYEDEDPDVISEARRQEEARAEERRRAASTETKD